MGTAAKSNDKRVGKKRRYSHPGPICQGRIESTFKQGKIMEKRYQVEWCSKMRFDEIGDMIPDLAEYSIRNFPTLGLADAFATKMITVCHFGCPQIHKQVFNYEYPEDKVKTWCTVESLEAQEVK